MEGLNKNGVVNKDENTQRKYDKAYWEEVHNDKINKHFERIRKEKIEHGEEIDEQKINLEYEDMQKFFRDIREHSEIAEKVRNECFKGLSQDQILEHHDFKARYLNHFAEDYINATIDSSILEENKKSLLAYPLLRERLKNSTLVDLGCGGPTSTELAYQFATAFGVKKYIGVEKYPDGNFNDEGGIFGEKDYEDKMKNIQDSDTIKKLLEKNTDHELPQYEFALNRDMLGFLLERKEQSNFLMSGVGKEILMPGRSFEEDYKYEARKEKHQNYINELEIQISRLTPEGGIVIINHSFINLEKFGFKKSYLEKKGNEKMVVWEKLKNKN